MISFNEALKRAGRSDKSILLGNGFSIAQGGGDFTYRSLLSKCNFSEELSGVFEGLDTQDFERVIAALENALIVTDAYGNNGLGETLTQDAQLIRDELLNAVKAVHPPVFTDISPEQIHACNTFLNNFSKVFTLNYDLLLYWVNVNRGKFWDGFGFGERKGRYHGPFYERACPSMFNLHGGLHLFLKKDRNLDKVCALYGETLMDAVSHAIGTDKRMPLFVAEGSSEEKLSKINSVPYLRHGYNELSSLTGSLFIYGHSANDSDAHIYDAIFKSGIWNLFFCVYDPERNLPQIREQLARFKERNRMIRVNYINASDVQIWN